MDGKNGLVLWVLGGTGVLFLYSAYKAKSPQAVLLAHLGATPSSTVPVVKPSTGNAGPSWQLSSQQLGPSTGNLDGRLVSV
jgi:hypothetical protein